MAKSKNTEATEENTAPDAASDDKEAGTTDANFTMAAGTPEEPAPLSDGTDTPSTASTTSSSPDATGNSDPLGLGASEGNPGAPDANKNETVLGNASGTAEDDGVDIKKITETLKGDDAEGHGPTHLGTDTPETLVSNPYNEDTGAPLFPKDNHSYEPLPLGAFKKDGDDAALRDKV